MLDDYLVDEMAGVPTTDRFPSVDELTAAMASLAEHQPDATLRRIGTSRLGEPLGCVTVGRGRPNAVVFAFPHPNEPVGGLTALHLVRRLCTDPEFLASTGLTWHIVPCIDPDGARLNEGWFGGPRSYGHYARHFYRPAGNEQVEWTFPFRHKAAYFDRAIPETVALMRLIDETEPAFLSSLHNSEYGGVYHYLSRPEPELYPRLQEIPAHVRLPLDVGEPEAPYIEQLATGVFSMIRPEDGYDYRERLGLDPVGVAGGTSSFAYAQRHGTLGLVTELPYWTDATAADDSPTTVNYADTLAEQADRLTELAALLDEALRGVAQDITRNSPFLRATRYFAPGMARAATLRAERAKDATNRRPATVAEVASAARTTLSFRLRYAGMLVRALDGEVAVGNGTPAIRAHRARLGAVHDQWCAEAESGAPDEPIPIEKLVAVQYAALLAAARHAAPQR